MRRATLAGTAAAALVTVVVAGCGKDAPSTATGDSGPGASPTELTATTPAPTEDVDRIAWALYREVGTLDPIQAFDYPENTVVTALCESLQRQEPDGSISPGVATLTHPDDTTLVIKVRDGVRFWDGTPVTAEDVAFSLQRAADPAAGSFYSAVFSRVKSITATGDAEVTVKLKQPDYWLDGELSSMPGVVVQKAYAEAQGRAFGSPSGGIMCTGAFKLDSWKAGAELSAVRNEDYWDEGLRAKVGRIDFKGVPDDASTTTGLLTGELNGTYPSGLGTMDQLEASPEVTVSYGPSFAMDAIVISNLDGVLGDVRVRRALSLALDRQSYINEVWNGAAQLPRNLANPGMWGYAREVFQDNWDALPEPEYDVEEGKRLIEEAGATGKTVTLGMTAEVANLNSLANAFRAAGDAIGLEVRFKAVSAQNFINFFTDPKAREGVDGFPTVNYSDYADPAAFYNQFATEGGFQNYSGFSDPEITKALDAARVTADPQERARHVVEAGDLIAEQLPWIPAAALHGSVITSSDLTGAPTSFVYMGGPWANRIGGT